MMMILFECVFLYVSIYFVCVCVNSYLCKYSSLLCNQFDNVRSSVRNHDNVFIAAPAKDNSFLAGKNYQRTTAIISNILWHQTSMAVKMIFLFGYIS